MSVVVITEVGDDVDPRPGIDLLTSHGFEVVVLWDGLPPAGSLPDRATEAVAAIVGFAPFGRAELDLFPNLRLVCTTSTGVDMVDVAAAADRDVDVVGLGGVATREVAAHALALILGAVREIPAGRRVVRGGGWTTELTATPRPVGELTLGLIGFGRIAKETARISQPLFARILATDPFVTVASDGIELVDLDTVLRGSDIVSLHLPVDDTSRGLMSRERIAAMRDGALLINVSRGELVDASAVLTSLEDGHLSGYAADVLDGEPPAPDDPLRTHPRAIVTPHMAFLSSSSLERYQLDPARTIIRRLTESDPAPGSRSATPSD